jgi:hypothetical protein
VPGSRLRDLVALLVLLAGCGGDDSGSGDDAPGDAAADSGLACGQELCSAVGARCGEAIDGCGDLVDCGTCDYDEDEVAADAIEPAIAVHDGEVLIAYVTNAPSYEVRLATGGDAGWTSEPIWLLDGEPRGPVDLVVSSDGTRWVVFVDEGTRIRAARAPKGGSWTVDEPLATGSAVAIELDAEGAPVIALAGLVETTSGVFVAMHDGNKWGFTPVGDPTSGGVPRSIALALGADAIDLVWRDPGTSMLRFASGRGSQYTSEIVDPLAAAPADDGALSLARGPGGKPYVLYGRGPGDLVAASRAGDTWQGAVLSTAVADQDNAMIGGPDGALHAAVFERDGLAVVDGLGGAWLFQTVADDCDEGDTDVTLDPDGGLHVAYSCGSAVRYLLRPPIDAE